MGVRIGYFHPIQLIFEVMNSLMKKEVIICEEAKDIIKTSLPPDMPFEKKEKDIRQSSEESEEMKTCQRQVR